MRPSDSSGSDAPIGVFDSGVGGLSVMRALLQILPHERFIYVGDNAYAPYGERNDGELLQRAQVITTHLTTQHHIKALVVACNTATAAAIHTLRARWPALPIVGMEPPLKPAAAHSRTGVVGVLATRSTLQSEKFTGLLSHLAAQPGTPTRFMLQACDGLADAIERNDATEIEALCARYTGALGQFGTNAGHMDTLVLGCTHYPFVASALQRCVGDAVALLDAGAPVARRTAQLLSNAYLLRAEGAGATHPADGTIRVECITTGEAHTFEQALARWLPGVQASVTGLALDPA